MMSDWIAREWGSRFGLTRPGNIIGIGLNYRDHAEEQGRAIPGEPSLFSKIGTSLIGPGETITLPPRVGHVDAEAELAVVIGSASKGLAASEGLERVEAVTCANDVSARDVQFARGQLTLAKGIDTFCAIGPRLVPIREMPPLDSLDVYQRIGTTVMQASNTANLIFGVPFLLEFISEYITLEPGDVILTGTPGGVGYSRKPRVPLVSGDRVEVEIEGVGVLSNPVADAAG